MDPLRKDQLGQRLLQIKKRLEETASLRAELQGELKGLFKRLKECGAESIKQAEEMITLEETALQELDKSIREKIEKIEQQMQEGEK